MLFGKCAGRSANLTAKLSVVLVLTALADLLFFHQPLGMSIGMYHAALLLGLIWIYPRLLSSMAARIIGVATFVLIAQQFNEPNWLAQLLLILSFFTLLILQRRLTLHAAQTWLNDILTFAVSMIFAFSQVLDERARIRKVARLFKTKSGTALALNLKLLLIPVALSLAFITLFAQANPMLERMMQAVDWSMLSGLLNPWRWFFWLAVGVILWPLFRPRFKLAPPELDYYQSFRLDSFISQRSVLYSLALFNLIFAVQNGFDFVFLWTSAGQLPDGMNYARYAQSGAYPLILTVILAALYILLVFNEHHRQYRTPMARTLVIVWVLQNIFLTTSAILRLQAYVAEYSLTHLRVAAFIWMFLISVGLLLTIIKIVRDYTNIWLINMNTVATLGVLFACALINFDRVIANYNVAHSYEVSGQGVRLDINYLVYASGVDAMPALAWYLESAWASEKPLLASKAQVALANLEARLRYKASDSYYWQGRTWHDRRLYQEMHLDTMTYQIKVPAVVSPLESAAPESGVVRAPVKSRH